MDVHSFCYNHTHNNDTPEHRFVTNPISVKFKFYIPKVSLRIGEEVKIMNNKTAFRKGYEPSIGKSVYQIYKCDGPFAFVMSLKFHLIDGTKSMKDNSQNHDHY